MSCCNQGSGEEAKGDETAAVSCAVQADDWILYSTAHQAVLARVRCGGWRRQYTHIVSTPSTFTFACYRNRHIHIDRRRGHDNDDHPGMSSRESRVETTCLSV